MFDRKAGKPAISNWCCRLEERVYHSQHGDLVDKLVESFEEILVLKEQCAATWMSG